MWKNVLGKSKFDYIYTYNLNVLGMRKCIVKISIQLYIKWQFYDVTNQLYIKINSTKKNYTLYKIEYIYI